MTTKLSFEIGLLFSSLLSFSFRSFVFAFRLVFLTLGLLAKLGVLLAPHCQQDSLNTGFTLHVISDVIFSLSV